MKALILSFAMLSGSVSLAFDAGNVTFKGSGHLKNGEEHKEYRVTVTFEKQESGNISMKETYIFSEDHQKHLAFTLVPSEREGCFGVLKGEEEVGQGCCQVLPQRGVKECHMGLESDDLKARRKMTFNKEHKTLVRSGITRRADQTIIWRDHLKAVPLPLPPRN